MDSKWCIQVKTKEFGAVLLLDDSGLPIPITFNTEEEAQKHIENIKDKYTNI